MLTRRLQTPPEHIHEHLPEQGGGVVVVVLVVEVLDVEVVEVELVELVELVDEVGPGPQGVLTNSQSGSCWGGFDGG